MSGFTRCLQSSLNVRQGEGRPRKAFLNSCERFSVQVQKLLFCRASSFPWLSNERRGFGDWVDFQEGMMVSLIQEVLCFPGEKNSDPPRPPAHAPGLADLHTEELM